ncbi:MAG: AAA family ATPase [bacterium]
MSIQSYEEMIDEIFSKYDEAKNDDEKPIVTIMVGNIGQGKSTLVRKLINMNPNTVVINKDSLLESICGCYGRYDSNKIRFYDKAERVVMESALESKYNVIVDRLNINKEQRSDFVKIAQKYGAKLVAFDFGAGSEEGLERRKKKNRGVPEKTWEEVFKVTKENYEAPTKEEGFNEILKPPSKWKFYAVDFDGTLVTNKFPEVGSLKKDTVEKIHKLYKDINNIIILWTCRSGDYLNQATTFLAQNNIPIDLVNENPLCGFDCSNKVFAHEYIDDLVTNVKDI